MTESVFTGEVGERRPNMVAKAVEDMTSLASLARAPEHFD